MYKVNVVFIKHLILESTEIENLRKIKFTKKKPITTDNHVQKKTGYEGEYVFIVGYHL